MKKYFLAIDFGNTRVKLVVFNKYKWKYFSSSNNLSIRNLTALIKRFEINSCIISSVTKKSLPTENFLKKHFPTIILNEKTRVPVKNLYETQSSLGKDRLACAVAAIKMYPGENVLVINCGTCITYDLVNREGEYLGGAISPGLDIKLKALNRFTSKLPLVKKKKENSLIGNSTDSSILNGVVNGTALEIDGFISSYKKSFPNLKVVLSGGDADYFASQLKNKIFVRSNIVLLGLNEILLFNAEK